MTTTPHLIYLHGFTSSPRSRKAQWFANRLADRGVTLHIPDLNVPTFEYLTLTAMLDRVAETIRALPDGPVALIGSSMGGTAALHFADRYRDAEATRVTQLLLMAPAMDFAGNRKTQLGEVRLNAWRDSGWLTVYHYGDVAERRVHYGLFADLLNYDIFSLNLSLPIRIYHGRSDASVPYEQCVQFAEPRPNVDLHLLDSDHQLLDQTDTIWHGMVELFHL
ncbi:MAG: alpha/beta fold hydrolase [Chloroflexi bacterium]|nr:alpha/beta fold hydrolase [Chloroflexota bacterium]